MTVIAWDGTALAADKRAIQGGGIVRTCSKITRVGDTLLAITGDWDVGMLMRAWYVAGAHPEAFPARCADSPASLIVIHRDGKISVYASAPYPLVIESARAAFGSGRDYAEAAMYCGKSAVEAVEIACIFQSDCGNGIDSLQFD